MKNKICVLNIFNPSIQWQSLYKKFITFKFGKGIDNPILREKRAL
ncbi:hypothetical protein CRENPOLYSF1_10023 [Crenothrix polyspora]|uniref:Uncharacterized protein n=1 Tax=Crenothrix polyspora TaxID=360316 RepID=A0A1R4GYX2_9GAMM|nr:hypothetical protein CRENPOLYSF1_10023 [Crenothrix polyspora]